MDYDLTFIYCEVWCSPVRALSLQSSTCSLQLHTRCTLVAEPLLRRKQGSVLGRHATSKVKEVRRSQFHFSYISVLLERLKVLRKTRGTYSSQS